MENSNALAQLVNVKKQRNIITLVCLALIVTNLLAVLVIFSRGSKTIILPSLVNREYSLTKSSVSNAYMEDISLDVVHLLLNVTPQTAMGSFTIFLQNVVPENYGKVKNDLIEIYNEVTRKNISTAFFTEKVAATEGDRVVIEGNLKKIVSGTVVSEERKRYLISLAYQAGRLWVRSFEEIESEEQKKG